MQNSLVSSAIMHCCAGVKLIDGLSISPWGKLVKEGKRGEKREEKRMGRIRGIVGLEKFGF